MYRLFVAVDLPHEAKEALRVVCRGVPEARWVPLEQLHLTLRFIGDADDAMFAAIKGALAGVKCPPFDLALEGVGHFPPGKRARVLWVGMEHNETLLRLAKEVELALETAGVSPEDRPFSPHITLARFREPIIGGAAFFEDRHRELALPPSPSPPSTSTLASLGPRGRPIRGRRHTL